MEPSPPRGCARSSCCPPCCCWPQTCCPRLSFSQNTLTGFTPKGRAPSEILICMFTFCVLLNPIQKHHASSVALAEKLNVQVGSPPPFPSRSARRV